MNPKRTLFSRGWVQACTLLWEGAPRFPLLPSPSSPHLTLFPSPPSLQLTTLAQHPVAKIKAFSDSYITLPQRQFIGHTV